MQRFLTMLRIVSPGFSSLMTLLNNTDRILAVFDHVISNDKIGWQFAIDENVFPSPTTSTLTNFRAADSGCCFFISDTGIRSTYRPLGLGERNS